MKQGTYHSLLVRLPGCSTPRAIFLRKHQPAVGDGVPHDTALFVAGVPFKLREGLQELFAQFGTVEKVQLHPRQTSAVAIFSSGQGVKRALATARKGHVIATEEKTSDQSTGLRDYVHTHKAAFPGNQKLKEELDAWMEAYEAEEERKRIAAQQSAADDGWTVVTRKAGRKRKQGQTVSGGVSLAAAEEHAARKKPKAINDFYRFQVREQKQSELLELRKEFSDAKKQLQAIRATRKFSG